MFENLDKSDIQNLLVIFLTLTTLLFSLIYNNSAKKIAKDFFHIAIMLFVIIPIIILLYSYRFEFKDFKNRIFLELNPGKAIVSKDMTQIIINSGEHGQFTTNIKLNEVEFDFLIDTGASDITIDLEMARKIGIKTKDLVFNKIYNTANGQTLGAIVKINSLKIANLEFKDVTLSVNQADLSIGLLGIGFLEKFKKYEFYQGKLILTP